MNNLTHACSHPVMTAGGSLLLIAMLAALNVLIPLAVNLFVIYQALRPQQENPHEHRV